jgi:hypothetical protein
MRMGAGQRNTVAEHARRGGACGAVLAVLLAFHPGTARAALGATSDELPRDVAALHGTRATFTSGQGYEVHEMVTGDGATVRQYVEPGGKVFAITWSGRFRPDLKVLLGSRYPEYEAGARAPHRGHHVLTVSTGDLAVTVVQLPRGWAGRAHVPSLVPSYIDVEQLR